MLPKASLTPQTYSKYIGWYYTMICGRLKKSQKMIVFRTFPLLRPKSGNVRKMTIFCNFFNLQQIIVQCHPMYLEYVWGVREAFGSIYSHFSWFLSKKSIFGPQIKKFKKLQKIGFFAKNQFLKNGFKLLKNTIYDMKWVPQVSYTCLKPILTIRTSLGTILGKSNFWSILKFFICGSRSKNREKPLKTAINRQKPRKYVFSYLGPHQKIYVSITRCNSLGIDFWLFGVPKTDFGPKYTYTVLDP